MERSSGAAFDGIVVAFPSGRMIEIRAELPKTAVHLSELMSMRSKSRETGLSLFTELDFAYSKDHIVLYVHVDPEGISTGYVRRVLEQFILCIKNANLLSKPIKWVSIPYHPIRIH